MRRAGKPLDQWQQDSLTLILAVDDDGLWVCYEYCELCSRQNGKGVILEARVLLGFLVLGEQMIMWSAHEYKTAKLAFKRMRVLFRALGSKINDNLYLVDGIYIKVNSTHGEEGFERLDTEAKIQFIARSKASGRGFTGDLNIIDEAFNYTDEHQEALGPTGLAVDNPQFIYTSSPPLTAATGEILYALRDRAEDIIKTGLHESLGYRDWGIEGDLDDLDNIDLDDRVLWAAANPALINGRLTMAKIQKLKRMLRSIRGFARECLGLWPRRAKAGGVIDMTRWADQVDVDSTMVGRQVLAIDMSPDRRRASLSAAGRRPDRLLMMETVKTFPGTAGLLAYVRQVVLAQNPLALVVDPGSAVGSLIPELEKMLAELAEDEEHEITTVLVQVSAREYAQACGALMDLMEADGIRTLGQPSLNTAAEGAITRPLGDAWAWDRRKPEIDITPLVAGTLAVQGFCLHEDDEDGAEAWVFYEDDDDDED